MSPAEFRAMGRRMIDLVADYLEQVESFPVQPPCAPGDIAAALPPHAPTHPESWEAILSDVQTLVIPGLMHWQSPNFFGFFPCAGSGPGILGDLLSTGLGVQGMLWATSPACTELETRVIDWLGEMIGLPRAFLSASERGGGVIQSTASDATLVALLAARHRVMSRAAGKPPHLTLYTSTQAHSSVVKAAMVAGLASGPDDRTHIRLIDVDETYALRADLLQQAIQTDLARGHTPIFCCATIGTTSSTAMDPLRPIGTLCRKHGLWLHVDAAFAGAACLCPEFRHLIDGVELCDSFSFNPHKWMLTSFDCAGFWTQDRRALTEALSITPEYLRNAASASGAVFDYRDWQVPLGRRFRALKLWMVIRHYGVSGLQAHIRHHIRLARLFESLVRTDNRFRITAPAPLSLVCFRLTNGIDEGNTQTNADALNKALLERVNASGKAYLSHTILPRPILFADRGMIAGDKCPSDYTLRMAIGSTSVQERHIRETWSLIQQIADDLYAR